jgi:hypothetical protein
MDTTYNSRIEIALRHEGRTPPIIGVGMDTIEQHFTLAEPMVLKYDLNLSIGDHKFVLEWMNKTNETADMAVIIDRVSFEGLTLDRMRWASRYFPVYPQPWLSEQMILPPACHASASYLGWNGHYELPFTVPVFTWIHQLENLGWIYD